MRDTNGDEIYFVRTVKYGLTKYLAEDYCKNMNGRLIPGSSDYYDLVESGKNLI